MRDATRYRYVTIGIPRDSEELAALRTEAKQYDVSLPKFLSMLLIDRHLALQGKEQGAWFPRGMTVTPAPQTTKPVEDVSITDTLRMRAVAAASAWDD